MQLKQRLTLILPTLGLLACGTGRSSDVKQSTIEQSYELTYNDASAQLLAGASFHYENTLGTSLKLTGNSSVSFNGNAMNYTNLLDSATYRLNMQMASPPAGPLEFRYINNDGEVFITKTRVPMPTVIKIPHDGESVRADRELAVVMQGDPLLGSDELTLCLVYESASVSTPDSNIRECLHSKGPLSLVFSREQLARFPSGRELKLEVKREAHPTQNNTRIHLTETWLSKPLYITLQ